VFDMLKKFVLAFLLVMLISTLVSAKSDSVTTGPYRISFDLGLTRDDYNVTIKEPMTTEGLDGDKRTEYSILITNETGLNRFATILIRNLATPMLTVSGSDFEQALNSQYSNNPSISGLKSGVRTIDGASGGIVSFTKKFDSGTILGVFQVDYQPAFDPTHTVVEIISTYPWDEGTLQLLKTIHVEKSS
jgi:hypothetical protein